LRSFGETDAGRKRRRNEDAFVCEPPLFAVADGMGGAQAGEVASSLAAAALSGAIGQGETVAGPEAERLVTSLIQEANRRVHQRAESDAAASGMGTTMTVALVGSDDHVAIGHVGDSRAYLLRGGVLEQLTDDHSLVAELVRRGELSPEEAEVHPQRSVITRALGTDPDVDVDVFSIEGRPGDVFLLCSDGLSTMVDSGRISEIVERNRADLASATRALINAANDSGGEDNITAVLFELDGAAPAPLEAPATAAAAAEPDATEADTLHPEDGVVLPLDEDGAEERRDGDTVIVPPPPAEPGAEADTLVAPTVEGDTVVVPAAAVTAALAESEGGPAEGEAVEEGREPFPVGRAILATLLIIVLAVIAVALAVWGLAR
jgi:protein phosphatase